MKNLIETLTKKDAGYGHKIVSVEFQNETLSVTTTNMMAVDAAFDENYDDNDNSERFYKTREDAQIALVREIMNYHGIDSH